MGENEIATADPIEVVNMDEFLKLDAELQKKIIKITEQLNLKSVSLFNPLVKRIIDIEAYRDLKYDADKPESIQAFKDAKKDVKNFRSSVKKTKGIIKKPLLVTGKDLDAIEKTFVVDATEVLEVIEKEFKPFLDAEEEKKIKAQAKRDKKKDDAIKDLSDESVENTLVIKRMNVFNKFTKDISELVAIATEQSATYSEASLGEEFAKLTNMKLEMSLSDEGILLEDQIVELQGHFSSSIKSAKTILKMKMDSFESAKDIKIVAPSLSDAHPNFIRDSIVQAISGAVIAIEKLQPALPKEKEIIENIINGLNNYNAKITDLFKRE